MNSALVTGLTLQRSKDYAPILEKGVRFTMATVEPSKKEGGDKEGWTSIYLTVNVGEENEQTFVLASLHNGKQPNQAIDFMITPMDKIKICCQGPSARVFLTGHWIDEDGSDGFSDEDSELDSELDSEIDDEDYDSMNSQMDTDDDTPRVQELDGDDSDAYESAESSEMEEEPKASLKRKADPSSAQKQKVAKTPVKEEKKTPAKKEKKTPVKEEKKTPAKEDKKTPAKKDKTPAKEAEKTPSKASKRVLAGGIVAQDFVVGDGKKATKGKRVTVYYEGRLENGKVFDSAKSGKGFGFRLGGGEVIKGWDFGVEGMLIGGKRRLTIPPAFAYGKKGAPPDIPKNATLIFDVMLRDVK